MVNCPNCGSPVREDAKFCGNCGIDVQAAFAAQAQAMAAQAATYQPPIQPLQQAYPLQTTGYSAYDLRRESPSPTRMRVLIGAAFVIAMACAFCCGVLFMAGIYEIASPTKPTPTPSKQTLEFIQLALRSVL